MCVKTLLSAAVFLFGVQAAWAQVPEGAGPNLVPNPGFEDRKPNVALPKDDVDGSAAFRLVIGDWTSPSQTTPDWLIVPQSKIVEAKRNKELINEPHGGSKMVGILTHNPQSERHDTYREYIQARLIKPLRVGAEYYFEFWVCMDHRAKFASNNIGFVLSPSPLTRMDAQNKWSPILDAKPDYNITEVINENKREWVRYSGTFKAANRAQYLIMGNFFDNKATIMKDVGRGGTFENAYYFLDDIVICELHPEPEKPVVVEPTPPPTLAEEPMEVGKKIELDHVYFETAKWKLLPESSAQLDELVALMEKHPTMEIEIAGHTDSRGSDSDNQKLSENRTRSVYEYLVEKGVSKSRMAYKGYGEKDPRADNDTEEGRAKNRRVEFVVTKIESGVDVNIKNDTKSYQGGDK